jgi:hypothetical protein
MAASTSPTTAAALDPVRSGSAMLSGLAALTATWLLGFGGLLTLWLSTAQDPRLPGLWAYRSATVGDGLLLPLLVGGLVWAAVRLGPARHDWRWASGAAVLGGTTGAVAQVLWLRDPNPRPNWTLPAAGHFTTAGWYHAAFLTAASAVVAGLTVLVVMRLRSGRRQAPERAAAALASSAPILLYTVGLSFAWLILYDSVKGRVTQAAATSVVTVVAAVVGSLVLVAIIVGLRPLLAALSVALLGSVGIALVSIELGRHPGAHVVSIAVCAVALGFGASWSMRLVGERRWLGVAVCTTAVLLGALAMAPASAAFPRAVVWVAAGVAALYLVLRAVSPRAAPSPAHFLTMLVVCGLVALAPWVGSGSLTETGTQWALWCAVFLIQFMYIVVEFDYERAAGFRRSRPAATPNVPIAAAALLPFGGAAVVAYFSFAVPAARAAGFEATTASTPWAVRPWQLATIAVVVALGAVLVNSRPSGGGPGDRIHLSAAATVLALGAATGWTAVMAATYRQAPGLDWLFVVGAVIAAVLLAVLTAESIVVSPAVLQGLAPGWRTIAIAVACGLGIFASVVWVTLSGIWAGRQAAGLPAALGAMGVAFGGGYGVAILCGLAVARGCHVGKLTEDPPWFNVVQDQFLYFALGSLSVWAAAVAFARVPQHDGRGLLSALNQAATLLGPFALLFVFTLKNNFRHLDRQAPRIRTLARQHGRPSDPEQWLRALRRHISLQASVAIGIAIVSVVGVTVTVFAAGFDLFKHLLPKD